MSQYQGADESTLSPISSGTQGKQPQHHDPSSTYGSEEPQGIRAEEQHAERRNDALDVSQVLGEIQRSICQLQSTLHGSLLQATTPYQRASFAVLTNIADDIADSLDWLRAIGSRSATARAGQPALRYRGSNTASVLQREDAVVGSPQAVCRTPGASPLGGSTGAAPSSAFQRAGACGPQAEGVVDRGGDTQPGTNPPCVYPYVQPRVAFPPTPELYRSQWVQTPPFSPLMSTPFFHHQQQQQHRQPLAVPGPSYIHPSSAGPDPAVVLQPPTPNTNPNHPHQGIHLQGEEQARRGQQQGQQQPLFPSPGSGVTMSLPLHYDTPAGARVALYQSRLPDHPSAPHPPGPGPREATTTTTTTNGGAVMQELAAAGTPPPSRAAMSPDGYRAAACPPGRCACADSGSDDEDGLGGPEAGLGWGYVFEE